MKTRMSVARCCCPRCFIFTSSFLTLENGSDIGPWSTTGTWEILNGKLRGSTADSFAIADAEHPDELSTGVVGSLIQVESLSTTFDLIINYLDDDNYLFARFIINGISSTATLFKRVTGVSTQIGSGAALEVYASQEILAILCYSGEVLSLNAGRAGSGLTVFLSESIASTNGTRAGLKIVSLPVVGAVDVSEFSFSRHAVDSPVPCRACISNCLGCSDGGPDVMKIVLAGSSNEDCSGCAGYNGTYFCGLVSGSGVSGRGCKWSYAFNGVCSDYVAPPGITVKGNGIETYMRRDSTTGMWYLVVHLIILYDPTGPFPGAQENYYWEKELGIFGPADDFLACLDLEDYEIPYSYRSVSFPPPGHIYACDFSASIAKITAIT